MECKCHLVALMFLYITNVAYMLLLNTIFPSCSAYVLEVKLIRCLQFQKQRSGDKVIDNIRIKTLKLIKHVSIPVAVVFSICCYALLLCILTIGVHSLLH